MPDAVNTVTAGLEDVLAGVSAISTVDGLQGRLIYRGYDFRDLVASSTFEETTYLLWFGVLPTRQQLDDFNAALISARPLPPQALALMRTLPKSAAPMAVVRTVVSALALYDARPDDRSPANLSRIATQLLAQTPTIVATWDRLRKGLEPLPPRSDLGLAANFLYMLSGTAPNSLSARSLDEAFIMHADHEFNASTFAVRVVVGTLADLYSAIVAGIGALKGPSHGGANQDVMRLLEEIAEPARAEAVIKARLAARQRIPGFGHRVYKTYDPRALVLKKRAQELSAMARDMRYYDLSQTVESIVIREKQIYPNVDFYSASTYAYMGIPADLFTSVFVISRMSGWAAHALEQYADNRLIRPRAEYTGPMDLAYIPIAER